MMAAQPRSQGLFPSKGKGPGNYVGQQAREKALGARLLTAVSQNFRDLNETFRSIYVTVEWRTSKTAVLSLTDKWPGNFDK